MRNVLWISIICLLLLVLVGCGQSEDNSSLSLILNENVMYPDNEPPYIQIINGEKLITVSEVDDYPSPPQISPDRTIMAFISPFEFEMIGHVWLFELSNQQKRKIETPVQYDGFEQSAKKVIWLDHDHVLILTGNAVGTVASNRSLFTYTLQSNELNEVLTVEKNKTIRDITLNENEVILDIGEYNYDFSDYTIEKMVMHTSSLLNAD